MTARILPFPPQANMLSALACAFEIVSANRDVLPESTSVVIWHGGRIRMHISRHGDGRDLNLDDRKACAAKVAGRLGLADDRGNGLSFSNPDRTLSVFTVADGPSHLDRSLAEQRAGIVAALTDWEQRFSSAGDRDAVGTVKLCAQVAREFRLEVEAP